MYKISVRYLNYFIDTNAILRKINSVIIRGRKQANEQFETLLSARIQNKMSADSEC